MDIVTVTDIINETKNIKTIKFNWPKKPEPGQFVMVWIPEVDEVPMGRTVPRRDNVRCWTGSNCWTDYGLPADQHGHDNRW